MAIARHQSSLRDEQGSWRQRVTVLAFAAAVVIGGVNAVAVRLSNQALPPFYGAGLRFGVAALVFLVLTVGRRISFPRGGALAGSVLYGFLGFGVAIALDYWALTRAPANVCGVVMSLVPLMTLFLARAHRLESITGRGLAGGGLTVAGIWILASSPQSGEVPLLPMMAMLAATAAMAEAGIIIKRSPSVDPIAANAVAMTVGAVVLLVSSAFSGETWVLPTRQTTWAVLMYLALVGSVGLFWLYLMVLKRWTASAASYQFVLMPLVTAVAAFWLADETITGGLVLGGGLVIAAVYLGGLSAPSTRLPAPPGQEALAQRCTCL